MGHLSGLRLLGGLLSPKIVYSLRETLRCEGQFVVEVLEVSSTFVSFRTRCFFRNEIDADHSRLTRRSKQNGPNPDPSPFAVRVTKVVPPLAARCVSALRLLALFLSITRSDLFTAVVFAQSGKPSIQSVVG